jgi:ApeA N-terminal domain 1
MSEVTEKKQAGTFHVDGRDMFGELTVDGPSTLLRLRSEKSFNERAVSDGCIHGTLHDLVKVSLFECISAGTGSASRKDQCYYFAEVFPHQVISGDRHLSPTDDTISSIHFVIDDAACLFYDFDAFGRVLRPSHYIETIAQANKEIIGRDVKTGPEPEIVYFAGRREIFTADTAIGAVSASHNPVSSMGGPRGVSIANAIPVKIQFVAPVRFDTAFDHLVTLMRTFELLIGRQQNVLDIGVVLGDGASREQYLKVACALLPQREANKENERRPHPTDILLSPINDPALFGKVLSAYLDREPEWKTPRARFASKFNQRYSYDVDRLIATANIFDIHPDSVFPPGPPISNEMSQARAEAKNLFGALPQSPDRDSILGALGRVGKLSLKKKIAARVKLVSDRAAPGFPDLAAVTERAVNCRNYLSTAETRTSTIRTTTQSYGSS